MICLPRPNPARRLTSAVAAVVAAIVISSAAAWAGVPSAVAGTSRSAALVGEEIATIDAGAVGSAPAVRLQQVAPPNFPMEPFPRCQILDNFGDPRSGGRTHAGSDMLATLGQEVYAMVDGTLTLQTFASSGGSSGLSGNLWKLTAATGGTYYIYAHLSAFAPGLSKGSVVRAGQVIGWVGDTGNAGPGNYHLHFEIHPGGGKEVDPLPLLTIPAACKVF
jgi:peptidoglycan LD-endopeptidase LytH